MNVVEQIEQRQIDKLTETKDIPDFGTGRYPARRRACR